MKPQLLYFSWPTRVCLGASLVAATLTVGGGSLPAAAPRAMSDEPATQDEAGNKPRKSGGPAPNRVEAAGKKKPPPTNRLAKETSPYLLMHAHNPVDWYPWGPEALDKAQRENKLIFLSVGYSSCHWCHVMERESFMDDEIAALLNEQFVCIKVDREERPDVDSIYMTAVMLVSEGNAGWPMSVFLTPDAKPFFGATYFPARDDDRPGMRGFLTIVNRVQAIWKDEPAKVQQQATNVTEAIQNHLDGRKPQTTGPLTRSLAAKALAALVEDYDNAFGGFGMQQGGQAQTPKFPEPSNLFLLLDCLDQTNLTDEQRRSAEKMLLGTLDHMAWGGIRDHLGGGFHRYSVDRFWTIPHFEKMLYDNAQLASLYSEAYRRTGREDLRQVVDELAGFVLRELTDEGGGFYAALDADSEDAEGKFYRWEKAEVERLLTADEMLAFAAFYGLGDKPNFDGEFYVPQLRGSLAAAAEQQQVPLEELEERLAKARAKLLAARSQRPRPLTDTKILTAWNGQMIRGLADAGFCLKDERYVQAARRAAEFVLANLRGPDGRLLRVYAAGEAKLNAYLDDYAYLVEGLLALHRATQDRRWLVAADELTTRQLQLFWDQKDGGFFFTSDDHESLLARIKSPTDSAQPSGNSVSAENLVILAAALDKPDYLEKAEATIQSISGILESSPTAAPRMVMALSALLELKERQ